MYLISIKGGNIRIFEVGVLLRLFWYYILAVLSITDWERGAMEIKRWPQQSRCLKRGGDDGREIERDSCRPNRMV